MENNKQTAVEWLFKQLWETPKDKFTWYAILEQAKAMHKEEIKEGYIMALLDGDNKIRRDAEDYYNETYKSE